MQLQKNNLKKIILGTAQLGLNYGVKKNSYDVSFERAEEILLTAFDLGIDTLDTAVGYGKSHEFIKKYHEKYPSKKFKIYSKVSLSDVKTGKVNFEQELGVNYLDGLMVHTATDGKDKEFRQTLQQLKKSGKVKNLGLSLYYDPEFKNLIEEFKPDFVQVPFNVLDNDSLRRDEFSFLSAKQISIHTRSTLMRGVLTHFTEGTYPEELRNVLLELRKICTHYDISPLALSLNYSLRKSRIEHVVIGVDTVGDLKECLESTAVAWNDEIDKALSKITIPDPLLLDLRKWP